MRRLKRSTHPHHCGGLAFLGKPQSKNVRTADGGLLAALSFCVNNVRRDVVRAGRVVRARRAERVGEARSACSAKPS